MQIQTHTKKDRDEPVAEPKPDEQVGGGDGSEANGQVSALYESLVCMRTYMHIYKVYRYINIHRGRARNL